LYEDGLGRARNLEEARRWYKKAAAAGNTDARAALALLDKGKASGAKSTGKSTPETKKSTKRGASKNAAKAQKNAAGRKQGQTPAAP
jgi:TPR repeat protein